VCPRGPQNAASGRLIAWSRPGHAGSRSLCIFRHRPTRNSSIRGIKGAIEADRDRLDFRLSTSSDAAAAKAFFREVIRSQGSAPQTIILDWYAASHRAAREMKAAGQLAVDTKPRSSKYLNNLIELDHRGVKLRIGSMLGFKRFGIFAATIADIELLRRIQKGPTWRHVVPST
jgi:transposase-like protein